jgi:hypothetical protein
MRFHLSTLATALALASLTLTACAKRNELPVSSAMNEDDDTFCRGGGKVAPGSAAYVTCRKERDAQRGNAIDRADKKQRNLAEDMLNNPVRP